jgi:hypothetical protein
LCTRQWWAAKDKIMHILGGGTQGPSKHSAWQHEPLHLQQ